MDIKFQFLINRYSLGPIKGADISRSLYLLALFDLNQLEQLNLPITVTRQFSEGSNLGKSKVKVYCLRSQKKFLIDRLNIFGISENEAQKDFKKAKNNYLITLKKEFENSEIKKNNNYPDFDAFPDKMVKHDSIQDFSLDNFRIKAKSVIINNRHKILHESDKLRKVIIPHNITDPLERHLIAEWFYSFPFNDQLCFIRNVLAEFSDNTEILMLFEGNDVKSKLTELKTLINTHAKIAKQNGKEIFVLTEGVTDSEFLKSSLGLLYPHLKDIYTFPIESVEGSASMLERRIESLTLTNTRNKVIGIFDNDEAAKKYFERSLNSQLPPNFRILKYPDLAFAKSYPVYNRTGSKSYKNINGIGMIIELYLGEDIIKNNGDYFPITIKNGQGLLRPKIKNEIRNRFREKVTNFNNSLVRPREWEGITSILMDIFNAFE